MSYRSAQHLHVLMLFSQSLCERVFSQSKRVQADFGLEDHEMDWFTNSDPRAFATDPLRSTRALAAVMEESSNSCAQLIRMGKGVSDLEEFFSSTHFHDCVRERGSMALSFFAHLHSLIPSGPGTRIVRDLIALEAAIARVRRARPEGDATGSKLKLSERFALLKLTPGTLSLFQQSEMALARHPVETRAGVVDETFPVPRIQAPPSPGEELLLVELPFGTEAPTIESPPKPLFQLLKAAEEPRSSEELMDILYKHGAVGEEAAEILTGLRADGLLIPA